MLCESSPPHCVLTIYRYSAGTVHGTAVRLQKKTKKFQLHWGIPPPVLVPTGSEAELKVAQVRSTLFPYTIDRRTHQMLFPHPEIHRRRLRTLNRAQQAIQRKYGAKYKIELFGSVRYAVTSDPLAMIDGIYLRYGVALPKSDLDMSIIVEFLGFLFALRIRHTCRIRIGHMA